MFRRRSGVRVRQRLRRVELWPVFKIALAFHAICGLISLGVITLVWQLGANAGFTDKVINFLVDIGFAESVRISGARLFRGASTITLGLVLHNTVVTVLLAVLYNVLSGLLGGVIINVVEDDQIRPSGRRSQAALHDQPAAATSRVASGVESPVRRRTMRRPRRAARPAPTAPPSADRASTSRLVTGDDPTLATGRGVPGRQHQQFAASSDDTGDLADVRPDLRDDMVDLDDTDWLAVLADDSLDEDTFGPGTR